MIFSRARLFGATLFLTLFAALPLQAAKAITPPENQYVGMARVSKDGKAALASVSSVATEFGLSSIAQGGNAIDAAATMAFTLGVVDGVDAGIGGGCFILARTAEGKILALDGREMAPAKASRKMYLVDGEYNPDLSRTGALAIGVPGCVAALEFLVKAAGKRSLSDAILPAAEVAENGFVLDKYYAQRLAGSADKLRQFPASAAIYLDDKGKAWPRGHVLVQADLAKTYKQLAEQGSRYFYRGDFAHKVEKWMKKNGGLITADDFAAYQMKQREPVSFNFMGYTVYSFPPPSSGGTHIGQILNILENYPLKTLSPADRYHYTIEAMKLAFADRAYWMGDADFDDVPKGLLDKAYAKKLSEGIDRKKAKRVESHGMPPDAKTRLFDRHTTHIAAADAAGNWVAITASVNTRFGSKVTIPGTGVIMNNQMDDFSAKEHTNNAWGLVGFDRNEVEAKKRPLSSMSPTIVLRDNKPVFTVGAAGGSTIINQVAQVLVNHLALDMSTTESLEAVRVHHQWEPDRVYIDSFAPGSLRSELKARGHELVDWPPFGATQAISLENGEFTAASEPRLKSRM